MNINNLLGLADLDADLARLEECLKGSLTSEDPLLAEVATHLVVAGGKRLRPSLTLACAAERGPAGPEVLLGGVSVELVHLASLYHDDVMDEAATRRNTPSVNAQWGNLVAIVAGDFLLARAAGIAAGLGNEIAGLLAATLARMCEGQIQEVHSAFDTARSESSYLSAIRGKTASLLATACRVGALTSELDQSVVESLTAYGEYFGMVYQIRDDIMDLVASDSDLGKAPGQDLVEGIYTLPVLLALSEAGPSGELADLLGRPLDGAGLDQARRLIRGTSGLAGAEAVGRGFAKKADEAAQQAAPGEVGIALGRLGHALLDTLPT
ncbi:MAG: polyprenyl synthetase family protein [Acidimicrobiales bacterium]